MRLEKLQAYLRHKGMEADRLGKSPYDCSPELVQEVKNIVQRMGGENT